MLRPPGVCAILGMELTSQRRGSQVVRQRSAKPLFAGSIPARASMGLLLFVIDLHAS